MTDGRQQAGAGRRLHPGRPVRLMALLLALIALLVAVRVLDSHRDQRNQVLLSLVQLGNLVGQEDAATSALLVGPSAARAAERSYASVQIAERLPYLRRQGLAPGAVDRLRAALARYQADAGSARTSDLAADVAAVNSLINSGVRSYKASYARWDTALDTTTVLGLVAAIAGTLAVIVWPRRHRPVQLDGGTVDSSPERD